MTRTKQGYRIELDPTSEQRQRLGQHAGLFRVVENFCLELVQAALTARKAASEAGVPENGLPKVPWSAPAMEAAWRKAHPNRYPWFAESDLSSQAVGRAGELRTRADLHD
jgi:putative transposase